MKAIMREIEEINALKDEISKTTSKELVDEYRRAINRKKKDIKEYCGYKNIDYRSLGI